MRIINNNNLTFGSLYTNIANKEVKKVIEQSPTLQEFAKDCDIHITDYKRRKKIAPERILEYGLRYRVRENAPKLTSKRDNSYSEVLSYHTLSLNDIPSHMTLTEYRNQNMLQTLTNEINNLTIEQLNKLRKFHLIKK